MGLESSENVGFPPFPDREQKEKNALGWDRKARKKTVHGTFHLAPRVL